jgi:oligopeptide transport system permease protein
MIPRLARTVGSAALTLWAIATGTFVLMEQAPGGPASADRRLDPAVEAANLVRLGLAARVDAPCDGRVESLPAPGDPVAAGDAVIRITGPAGTCAAVSPVSGSVLLRLSEPSEPARAGQILLVVRPGWPARYARFLASIATLDLGVTYTSRGERTVRENLADGLPVSASVGALALLVALALGIPGGLLAASRRGTWTDRALTALATAAVSTPAIVLGPVLLYLFAIRVHVFRPGGLASPADLVLPACTLGIVLAGVIQRMTRAGAVGFLAGGAVDHLRARGLSRRRILGIHALRHAAIPALGYLPPAVASLLTGSVVVEQVYNLPGISRYLVGAALNRDHPMVLGVVLTYSLLLVACTTLAELLHPVVDPRVRRGGGPGGGGGS